MRGQLRDLTFGAKGEQHITITVTRDFREDYDALKDGYINVEIKKWREPRSKDANAYFHVLVNKIAEAQGLGDDEVKRGSKLLTKLWNASKYVLMNLTDFEPSTAAPVAVADRFIEDRWVLSELNKAIAETRRNLDKYDNYNSRAAIDTFFYDIFCDQYLEFTKDRFWSPEKYDAASQPAAQWTLYTVLRAILGLYAPFIPFLTEELWQKIYQDAEGGQTLHLTAYPTVMAEYETDTADMQVALVNDGPVTIWIDSKDR